MFSLFPQKPSEENPPENKRVFPQLPVTRSTGIMSGLVLALLVVLTYGIHERNAAASFSAKSAAAAAELKDTQAQISALSAKLDSLMNPRQDAHPVPAAPPKPRPVSALHPAGGRQKPDPRWKKVQDQIDAQQKQIESTRQEVASTRSDLQDSVAKTHEELVLLEKKGERSYFEFDLDKSKNFNRAGPVGISLHKANTKHQYADLELLVDDRKLSKKHLNLYEPAIFYPSEERQPVELVINDIGKNHIHGYISAAKYRSSELSAGNNSGQNNSGDAPADTKVRRRLDPPR
ncbi:MAG TPA: hypothetical protein VKZ53_08340 [Candidatus Angelobacter sp.]|nr:hypothetical protein [Candidatus Angelobacter sp.]